MVPPPVDVIMSPGPVIQSAGPMVNSGTRFVTPMDNSVTPQAVVGNVPDTPIVIQSNGDEAIIQAGNFVHPIQSNDNMIVTQHVHPAQMPLPIQQQQAPPPGQVPCPIGGAMMPAGNQAHGVMATPNMPAMPGMTHYIPPYNPAGKRIRELNISKN